MRSRVLAELVALFAPPACAACRTPLGDAGDALCASCRRELPWLRALRCPRCALPAPCDPCPAGGAAFDAAWAPTAYAGPARALVAALKFDRGLALADLMAAQIAATVPEEILGRPRVEAPAGAGPRALVPVPTHPARARRRGFDQAEQIARALARRTGLPLVACLRRTGPAATQTGASRRKRTAAHLDFTATHPPQDVVIVDDVHTTGATLDAAARALKRAGARHVTALTYARTLRP